jgi:hypothetical protein
MPPIKDECEEGHSETRIGPVGGPAPPNRVRSLAVQRHQCRQVIMNVDHFPCDTRRRTDRRRRD